MTEVNTEQQCIKNAMSKAIQRSGRQKKDIAAAIGITPQNLSNLINDPKRDVPLQTLRRLAFELDDTDFKFEAADWMFGLGFAKSGVKVIPIPIAVKEDVDDEQDDREQLDREAKRIFKQEPGTWGMAEVKFIHRYRKELNEEVSAEHRFLDAIDDALKKVSKEVIAWA